MNHFYNQLYESFFVEKVSFLAVSKKEARRHAPVHGMPRSCEGEEENTATGLPTEGEPHIKAELSS